MRSERRSIQTVVTPCKIVSLRNSKGASFQKPKRSEPDQPAFAQRQLALSLGVQTRVSLIRNDLLTKAAFAVLATPLKLV
jgi:hypothetical protein